MKDLRKETAKLLAKSSKNIAQMVASSAFEFWQRKDFRLYVDFKNISQTEQDRMFNELEVSVLGLFVLKFEQASEGAGEDRKIVFTALKKDLPAAFIEILADTGIEEQYLDIWKKLIDMRLTEYRRDLKLALKESKNMTEFEKDDSLRTTWARIETITIDCLSHIRRGDVKEDDPLWKLLRKWIITLDAKLTPLTQEKS